MNLFSKDLWNPAVSRRLLNLIFFTHLADQAKDNGTLATEVGAVPQRLVMLLEALRQIGITSEEAGKWSLTAFAKSMFVPDPERPNLYMIPLEKPWLILQITFI